MRCFVIALAAKRVMFVDWKHQYTFWEPAQRMVLHREKLYIYIYTHTHTHTHAHTHTHTHTHMYVCMCVCVCVCVCVRMYIHRSTEICQVGSLPPSNNSGVPQVCGLVQFSSGYEYIFTYM